MDAADTHPSVTAEWIRNHVSTSPLIRHLKRRTVYKVEEIVQLQMSGTEHDDRELVLYRDLRHGVPWVRPIEDFADRFEVAGPEVGWALHGERWHAVTRPAGASGPAWTLCSRGVIYADTQLERNPTTFPRCATCARALAQLTGETP